jgi:cyclopropane fatty-acyl-phospholipid synthase-like methyltransferase
MKSIEYLKNFYEEKYNSIDFDQLSSHNKREIQLYRKYWKLICKKTKRNHINHLDLGCGIGTKTYAIKQFVLKSTGVDLSEVVISKAKRMFEESGIIFKADDAFKIDLEYDLITAFGFSLFNEKDIDIYTKHVFHFLDVNLSEDKGMFVLGSFTDFSGKGEESWYLHTKSELECFKKIIEASTNYKVTFVFPHRKIGNYIGFGIYNFMAEVYKALKKRKNYFIVISNG